ncbi:MAG: site-specific DNA-methyltransferase [Bacteroidetes bacterium]|nr:site-specific DNA-methyltransferase [Bacteroidota bacterium]MBL7103815.1 site-specific DNA-methyltransferase [Bacteroidales bacterium]
MINTTEIFPSERQKLFDQLADKLETAYNLSRKVVSFQANKDEPIYRWFKYKEGFSSALVKYFLTEYSSKPGKIFDPFAGTGTNLFAAQELGWQSYGVELLPVGTFVMQTRQALNEIDIDKLRAVTKKLWADLSELTYYKNHINHISITKDAFPDETEEYLNKYLTYCSNIKDKHIETILRFAAFAVLEEISYTRKDGQYLRWDYRSKRDLLGKPFDKGKILTFEEALKSKLNQIIQDLSPSRTASLFEQFENSNIEKKPVKILEGSCLKELPKLDSDFFDFIITSPPYCNRYDYTRTYALELIFLGYDNDQVRNLRQSMLSCTVENKEKIESLRQFYVSISQGETFEKVVEVYNDSKAMTEVNAILDELKKLKKLNNSNIARMVKNYFLELCFVIYEMERITKSGGYCVMVNDNVRYGGEEIPVDLILSEFAENFGFNINKIFVLPKGKGNSSQQMGNYGRTEVRKCVYLWQKR